MCCAEATAELLHEFGRDGLTVGNIVRLAGTSRGTFYDVFSGAEECLSYTARVAGEELFAALEAQRGEGEWPLEVKVAIGGFFAAVAARPLLAEVALIHARSPRTDCDSEAAWSLGRRFVPLLHRGQAVARERGRRPPGDPIEACLSGAIVSLATRRVRGPEVGRLEDETIPTTALVLGFYLGRESIAELLVPKLAA